MATAAETTPSTAPAAWTPQAVRDLGMTTDVETAGAILGIGRTRAYELARSDAFPVRIIHLGRRLRVSVPELLRFLGIAPENCD